MLGVVSGDRLTLFRRGVDGGTERWRTVRGGAAIGRALAAAQELSAEASAVGGWGKAHSLSLNPQKPGQPGHVEAVVLTQDGTNGGLGELKVARRADRPGPVRVGVVGRRLSIVPASDGARR